MNRREIVQKEEKLKSFRIVIWIRKLSQQKDSPPEKKHRDTIIAFIFHKLKFQSHVVTLLQRI